MKRGKKDVSPIRGKSKDKERSKKPTTDDTRGLESLAILSPVELSEAETSEDFEDGASER